MWNEESKVLLRIRKRTDKVKLNCDFEPAHTSSCEAGFVWLIFPLMANSYCCTV